MRRWLIGVAVVFTAIGVLELVRPVHGPAYRSTNGASLVPFTLHSRATKRDLHEILVLPHAGQAAFLLVLLHGRGASPSSWLSQPFFDELHALGSRAPAVLLLDGGDHSYWHDRRDGRWGTMVLREAIPAGLARTKAGRVALGGISMGGFGAYDLALLHPGRFCAVGGHSPALWFEGGETAPGAFDSAEDFNRNNVVGTVEGDPEAFGNIPIWNDYGSDDPFKFYDEGFVDALDRGNADLSTHSWPGGHNSGYWDSHWHAYLRFYADALAHC